METPHGGDDELGGVLSRDGGDELLGGRGGVGGGGHGEGVLSVGDTY
ncbi:hypothetical protein [Leifsonia sp. NPDC058248]